MNILLIEDEAGVSNFIKKGLEESQHHVTLAYEGAMGLQLAMTEDFDLIILDVILPQVNGFEICSEIKHFKPEIPVLMLTALSTIQDKLKGFDKGADDYLTKTVSFRRVIGKD